MHIYEFFEPRKWLLGFKGLIKVTSFVLKFVDLCRKSCDVNNWDLTATDISKAERIWIKTVQEDCFDVELQSLGGKRITILLQHQLNLSLENEGVTVGCTNPTLKPTCYYFTDSLITQKHNQIFYDGIHETLNLIRETYWIRCGRESVKKVLYKCVACRRYDDKALPTPPCS